jgi:hypothetical protein
MVRTEADAILPFRVDVPDKDLAGLHRSCERNASIWPDIRSNSVTKQGADNDYNIGGKRTKCKWGQKVSALQTSSIILEVIFEKSV